MNAELIETIKSGHRVLKDGSVFVVTEPGKTGLAKAVPEDEYHTWHKAQMKKLYGTSLSQEEASVSPCTLNLAECEALEQVNFKKGKEVFSIKTGGSILLNGEMIKLFYIDACHLEAEMGEGYRYTYHTMQFEELIDLCKAEVSYANAA